MKRYLFSSFLSIGLIFLFKTANAQACIPGNDSTSGFSPDTLSTAFVGIPYQQDIQFFLPPDTTVDIFNDTLFLYLDSLFIDSVVGLPPEFSYACNTPNCIIYGGTNGCAVLSGTADTTNLGLHQLYIYITIFLSDTGGAPLFLSQSYDFYFLDVELATGQVSLLPASSFALSNCYPNPASNVAMVSYTSSSRSDVVLNVTDLYGKQVSRKKLAARPGINLEALDVSKLQTGMYNISITQNGVTRFDKLEVMK